MPTIRVRFLAVLCATVAAGSAGAQPGRAVPLPGGNNAPDVDVLRRLTAQLGGGNPANPFDLNDLVKKFGNGGKIDQAGLQDALKKLPRDAQQKLFNDLMKQWGDKLPPGMKIPDGLKFPDNKLPNLPFNPQPFNPPPLNPQPINPNPQPIGPRPPEVPDAPGVPEQPRPVDPFQPLPNFPRPNFNPPPMGMPNTPAAKEAIEFWEKNFGSLNDMPAVRDALVSLVTSGMEAGGGKSAWDDIMKDLTSGGGGDFSNDGGFLKWFRDNTGNWSMSGSDSGSNWIPPGSGFGGGGGSSFSGGGFGAPSASGLGTVGIVLLSVIGAVILALFFWKILPAIREGRAPRPLPGMGPWPVDPRTIHTRDELVRAFEYLSVLECGERAKTWNHVTIAVALVELVPDSAAFADALARLYELARYTPEAEPISAADIAEARGYLCQLARVSA